MAMFLRKCKWGEASVFCDDSGKYVKRMSWHAKKAKCLT